MNAQRIQRTNQIFASFYKSVQQRGALTITELAALYDQLSINEVLLDGNTRNRVLALTHITTQYGYPPPDFNRAPHSKLIEMLKKYPTDHRKATVEFLREALPIMPLA